jgi:hypothetical protein
MVSIDSLASLTAFTQQVAPLPSAHPGSVAPAPGYGRWTRRFPLKASPLNPPSPPQDIKATLDRLQILLYSQGHFYINANTKIIDYHLQKCGGEGVPVDMDKIHWTPHLSSDRWLR